MTNFPDYLTEEQKEFWSNLDDLRIQGYPESTIYNVTFAPSKRTNEYIAIIFFRYSPTDNWMFSWLNEDGTRNEEPYVVRKEKEVPYTFNDILDISDNWFRAKNTHTFHKLEWVNVHTLCIGLAKHGGISIDKFVEDYIHSPNGKDWYPLTKKV